MRLNSTHYLIRSTGRGLGSWAGNYRHTSLRKPLPGVLVVCAFASFVWYYCLHSWDGGVPTRTELTSAGIFSALKNFECSRSVGRVSWPQNRSTRQRGCRHRFLRRVAGVLVLVVFCVFCAWLWNRGFFFGSIVACHFSPFGA